MEKPIIITSALPYANGPIHIGHLVEYIQTDIVVRALKLSGYNVIYCCADDTHGTAIEINAKKLGITPKQFIKKWYKEHQEDFASFLIEFDSYYSTDSEENKYFADYIFTKLKDNGLIYEKEIQQLFCPNCKRFLPDRYVKGICPKCGATDQYGDHCEICGATYNALDLIDPYCVLCHTKPILKISTHYFFKLSQFSNKLKQWISDNKYLQKEIKNQILNWIESGLKDWCISRDAPYFGFKIPGTKDKYYYVWLDAPVGYISSLCNYLGKDKVKTLELWNNSEIIHFIGKDIIYFHLLFWPAMLMGSGLNLPKQVFVHGFLNINGEKMSKSRGTFLTAKQALNIMNPEHLRFYYASNLSDKVNDINLDFKDFKEKINNELIDNIANFIYRTTSFAYKHFKDIKTNKGLDINNFYTEQGIDKIIDDIKNNYLKFNLRQAVNSILKLASHGNKYFQENRPWELIKNNREKCEEVILYSLNIVKDLIILLKPILPRYAKLIEQQLGLDGLDFSNISQSAHFNINNVKIIFTKIEDIKLDNFNNKIYNKENLFDKLDLRVAKIISVQDHPNADKLYLLKIDLGDEKRQLVAGLKPFFKKHELANKNIIVVSNLKKARIRGYDSEGMLLAAQKGSRISLLLAPNSDPGDKVYLESLEHRADKKPTTISFEEFSKIKLYVKDKKIFYENFPLRTKKEYIIADIEDNAIVR